MNKWKEVDNFLLQTVIRQDEALLHALQTSRENNLPEWEVSPEQGQFLFILAKMKGAKRILELGTMGRYSTIWLGYTLPEDGKIVSLEFNHDYAKVARENIIYAGLEDKVTIIEGNAIDTMQELISHNEEPFDMIFIDADKPNNPLYLELSLKLSKKGTIIFGDNVIREGQLANANSSDLKVCGVRKYIEDLGKLPNVITTGIQTVGCKGYDGFSLSLVE